VKKQRRPSPRWGDARGQSILRAEVPTDYPEQMPAPEPDAGCTVYARYQDLASTIASRYQTIRNRLPDDSLAQERLHPVLLLLLPLLLHQCD